MLSVCRSDRLKFGNHFRMFCGDVVLFAEIVFQIGQEQLVDTGLLGAIRSVGCVAEQFPITLADRPLRIVAPPQKPEEVIVADSEPAPTSVPQPSSFRRTDDLARSAAEFGDRGKPVAPGCQLIANFPLGNRSRHRGDGRNADAPFKQATFRTSVGTSISTAPKRSFLGRVAMVRLNNDQRVVSQTKADRRSSISPIFSSTVETNSAYCRRGDGKSR